MPSRTRAPAPGLTPVRTPAASATTARAEDRLASLSGAQNRRGARLLTQTHYFHELCDNT